MILITGANGQIGVDLLTALCDQHGRSHVLASDLAHPEISLPRMGMHPSNSTAQPLTAEADASSPVSFEVLDVRDASALDAILDRYPIHTIYHLAGILSAKGEQHPDLCWDVNVGGLRNVLHATRKRNLRLFWPSSIAVFGPKTPRDHAPQTALTDPKTMYGISKVTGEQLSLYYAHRFGIDVRSLRFPGVISYTAPPGGGTTDYAVDMFAAAVTSGRYTCFVSEHTKLPMMYMPDAVKSILKLMQAAPEQISIRSSYNVTAFSFTAGELAAAIRNVVPKFTCTFEPDFRQSIADSWPRSIDDAVARDDWNWKPDFDLTEMVVDMLNHVSQPQVSPSPSLET